MNNRNTFAACVALIVAHALACTADATSPAGAAGIQAGSAGSGGAGGLGTAGVMDPVGGFAGGALAGATGGTLAGTGGMAAGTGGAGTGGTGGAAAGDGAAGMSAIGGPSAAALVELAAYLETARSARADQISDQPFATVPLTQADAEQASAMVWDDYAAWVRETRAGEMGATESMAATIEAAGSTLRYYVAERGAEPATGRSLFISMHGGGNAPAATNDSQWENQIALVDGYDPQDALWIAPRAPIDDWNMWFVPEIDPLFDRLITNMIVFEGIDPNKVYLTGYSAGGDGVYQLGPRMADRWAGAAMSAGHPNDASPVNLRNVAFAIHVGGNDTAYDRNLKGAEWGEMLEALAAADDGGYHNQWQVHAGLPHWMELEDAVAIPFVQGFSRDPVPVKVVWRQVNVTQPRFYWLAVAEADEQMGTTVTASYAGDTVTLSEVTGLSRLTVRASDAMLDLDLPVRIERDGEELFTGMLSRTIAVIAQTLDERGDPAMVYSAQTEVALE
jgi:poly(3-hydroxybutyrate) depolymerase